ncbi:polysaccharide pyruvyl transferase family protein, partial [Streptomyces sp. gb1(2016)]|uniref:polysaccharide pyruvyl transferase family protein n=1 Tax=Streptomyces sp. gb1(2016) TaxID=1828321 RepID=UPI0039671C64
MLPWIREPTVREFVTEVLNRSASIGVRGEFTEQYLKNMGFRDVEVIGCPSMFMNGETCPSMFMNGET